MMKLEGQESSAYEIEEEGEIAHEVPCKLAEFLVSSTVKYCLARYVSRMLCALAYRDSREGAIRS